MCVAVIKGKSSTTAKELNPVIYDGEPGCKTSVMFFGIETGPIMANSGILWQIGGGVDVLEESGAEGHTFVIHKLMNLLNKIMNLHMIRSGKLPLR